MTPARGRSGDALTIECPAGRPPTGAWRAVALSAVLVLGACGDPQPAAPPAPAPAPLAAEVVFLGYAEDVPESILETFSRESGVKVRYEGYQSPEEAAESIRGGGDYDLAAVENQLVPALVAAGLLAEIDRAHVPNFNNISAAFRDLAIDPGNRYSVPDSYGTTGLLVRTDLVGEGPRLWADLWDPAYAGRIGLRAQPREVIGLTLVSLGQAFNSESPQALEAACQRLQALRPAAVLVDIEAEQAVPRLLSGELAILHGYAEDYRLAHAANPAVSYVLPGEGTALWGDSFVVPARSRRQRTAAELLNFLLRADIAAIQINEKAYAQPNDAAQPLVEPAIRDDPVIYPPMQRLKDAHITLPLSPEGERRYAEVWARCMGEGAAGPQP
jgi:spermidine/putrescine transport system substrate-binding protein